MLLYIMRAYILCFAPPRLCRKSTQAFKTRKRLPVVKILKWRQKWRHTAMPYYYKLHQQITTGANKCHNPYLYTRNMKIKIKIHL